MADQYKSRTVTIEQVKAAGFEPDPYRWRASALRDVALDPFAFIKEASFGGYWRLELDYRDKSYGGYSRHYDGRLREVQISYSAPDVEPEADDQGHERLRARQIFKLFKPGKYDLDHGIWFGLPGESVRDKFHNLVKDIELAVWIGIELDYLDEAKRTQRACSHVAKIQAEKEPLTAVALGDGEHGYGSPWNRIAQDAQKASRTLADANGTTDVVQAVYDLTKALDAITDALTPEASATLLTRLSENLGVYKDAHAPSPRFDGEDD